MTHQCPLLPLHSIHCHFEALYLSLFSSFSLFSSLYLTFSSALLSSSFTLAAASKASRSTILQNALHNWYLLLDSNTFCFLYSIPPYPVLPHPTLASAHSPYLSSPSFPFLVYFYLLPSLSFSHLPRMTHWTARAQGLWNLHPHSLPLSLFSFLSPSIPPTFLPPPFSDIILFHITTTQTIIYSVNFFVNNRVCSVPLGTHFPTPIQLAHRTPHLIVLYCTVLYCTVLYCTVLYCTVLYCTVLYGTVRYGTSFYQFRLFDRPSTVRYSDWSRFRYSITLQFYLFCFFSFISQVEVKTWRSKHSFLLIYVILRNRIRDRWFSLLEQTHMASTNALGLWQHTKYELLNGLERLPSGRATAINPSWVVRKEGGTRLITFTYRP